jgi:RimJ/RimL family protein N-acetyltransferase
MSWVNDREVMQYFAARQKDITRDEELKYIEQLVASRNDRAFSIFDDDDQYVGQCSINQIHWPSLNGRLFIVIRKEQQGKGHGPMAICHLLDLAFGDPGCHLGNMGLHKIWLIVRAENLAAQAMYLKAGFAFEGLLKDEYMVGERFHDMVRMGVINRR